MTIMQCCAAVTSEWRDSDEHACVPRSCTSGGRASRTCSWTRPCATRTPPAATCSGPAARWSRCRWSAWPAAWPRRCAMPRGSATRWSSSRSRWAGTHIASSIRSFVPRIASLTASSNAQLESDLSCSPGRPEPAMSLRMVRDLCKRPPWVAAQPVLEWAVQCYRGGSKPVSLRNGRAGRIFRLPDDAYMLLSSNCHCLTGSVTIIASRCSGSCQHLVPMLSSSKHGHLQHLCMLLDSWAQYCLLEYCQLQEKGASSLRPARRQSYLMSSACKQIWSNI